MRNKEQQQVAVQSFIEGGGRILRFKDFDNKGVERTVTVACRIDRDGIRYGSSVHKRYTHGDHYDRKAHNWTAVARFYIRPVRMHDNGDRGQELISNFPEYLEAYGYSGPRNAG